MDDVDEVEDMDDVDDVDEVEDVDDVDLTGARPGPTDGPAVAPPPGRNRPAVVALAGAVALLVAAAVFGGLALQAGSKASDARAEAASANDRREALASAERRVEAKRDALRDQVFALPDSYDAVDASFEGLLAAHDHFIDLLNDAIARYNAGDGAGGAAVIEGEAATAVTDLMTKKAETQQAVQAAEDALHQLQEAT